MSQRVVYEILASLGGEATLKEIKAKAKETQPGSSIPQTVGVRLKKLKNWGYIEYIVEKKNRNNGKYKILEPYPSAAIINY